MRPTFSILFFTVMSGAGYGLWLLISLAMLFLWPEYQAGTDQDGGHWNMFLWPGLMWHGLVAGFILVSAGLLSSLGHLGKPGRAWRAFSQWRSSWLSREGVASILTFVPVGILALCWLRDVMQVRSGSPPGTPGFSPWLSGATLNACGLLLLVGALVTIFCTANIYACLKPIRAWHNRYVVMGYLLLGAYSGGLWAWALTTLPDGRISGLPVLLVLLILLAIAGATLKLLYWRFLDRSPELGAGDAIGLKAMGSVRSFEQPHTEENYLTHEMGFRLARKHSRKLRAICLIAGFGIPAFLALLGLYFPGPGTVAAWIALPSGMAGIFLERWLFFAEAKHTVMLYYGARSA